MKKKENEFNNPERIYGNPASWLDKAAAVGGILTLGTSHWVKWIPTVYSGGRSIYNNW